MACAVVLLPGTGSDDVFIRSVFQTPLEAVKVALVAPRPVPGADLVRHYLAALDAASADGPVLAGGVSLGAHVAAEWACAHPEGCAGLLLALPAWHGPAEDSPAAVAARLSSEAVRRDGVDETLRAAAAGVAPWLALELDRAWRVHGNGLADSLLAAVDRAAPSLSQLSGLTVPAGIAAVVDDPVHPLAVAEDWASALPRSALRRLSFEEFGADRAALGRAAVSAWLDASGQVDKP
jgi:pimeloyl-ACP methyl ester carboxylesterase